MQNAALRDKAVFCMQLSKREVQCSARRRRWRDGAEDRRQSDGEVGKRRSGPSQLTTESDCQSPRNVASDCSKAETEFSDQSTSLMTAENAL